MKTTKTAVSFLSLICVLTLPLAGRAADANKEAAPYPLDNSVVSGEKIGGKGDGCVFTCQGQEIKMCCNNCLKDFNKEPDKYIKKIQEAARSMDESAK